MLLMPKIGPDDNKIHEHPFTIDNYLNSKIQLVCKM